MRRLLVIDTAVGAQHHLIPVGDASVPLYQLVKQFILPMRLSQRSATLWDSRSAANLTITGPGPTTRCLVFMRTSGKLPEDKKRCCLIDMTYVLLAVSAETNGSATNR